MHPHTHPRNDNKPDDTWCNTRRKIHKTKTTKRRLFHSVFFSKPLDAQMGRKWLADVVLLQYLWNYSKNCHNLILRAVLIKHIFDTVPFKFLAYHLPQKRGLTIILTSWVSCRRCQKSDILHLSLLILLTSLVFHKWINQNVFRLMGLDGNLLFFINCKCL